MVNPIDVNPVRFSRLKVMGRSAMHYEHELTEGRPDNAAMLTGRLVHWRVLGAMPDDEEGRLVIYDGERRGNAWKDFRAAAIASDPKCTIVTRAEYDESEPIAKAVLENETAAPFLQGERERRILWKIGDRACRSTLDVLGRASFGPFVTDLKTTTDASPGAFMRLAIRMGYAAQMAFYQDAARSLGLPVEDVYLVAVEVRAPFAVTTFRLTPQLLDFGRRTYRGWFERLMVCEQTGEFPGYASHVVTMDAPEWMLEQQAFGTEEDEDDEAAA